MEPLSRTPQKETVPKYKGKSKISLIHTTTMALKEDNLIFKCSLYREVPPYTKLVQSAKY